MLVYIAQIAVLVAGVSFCVFAGWGINSPNKLVRWMTGMMDEDGLIYYAVIARVVLGLALIIAAPDSQYQMAFLILGWVTIVAAVAIAIVGRTRLRRFINWCFEQITPLMIRLWLVFAIAFGGFLIYGV